MRGVRPVPGPPTSDPAPPSRPGSDWSDVQPGRQEWSRPSSHETTAERSTAPSGPLSSTCTCVERVPTCRPEDRVAEIREALVEADHESVDDIAVCEDGRLLGLIPLRHLLAAAGDARASTLMDSRPAGGGRGTR